MGHKLGQSMKQELSTYKGLYDWLVMFDMASHIDKPFRKRAWERALEDPSMGKIYSFYHCLGLTEPKVLWSDINACKR